MLNFPKRRRLDSNAVVRRGAAAATETEDGLFLVDERGGRLYRLNDTGKAVWEKLDQPIQVTELSSRLAIQFHCDQQVILRDVMELLNGLYARGLLQVVRDGRDRLEK